MFHPRFFRLTLIFMKQKRDINLLSKVLRVVPKQRTFGCGGASSPAIKYPINVPWRRRTWRTAPRSFDPHIQFSPLFLGSQELRTSVASHTERWSRDLARISTRCIDLLVQLATLIRITTLNRTVLLLNKVHVYCAVDRPDPNKIRRPRRV